MMQAHMCSNVCFERYFTFVHLQEFSQKKSST